jgi:branched-chain amino acid transport system substrate-binding protein
LNQKQIPQLFIFSGASRFGDPKNYPWTMGWQPDYATEGGVYAKHILASGKDARIGILFQNDDSGKDGVIGFQKTLGKQNEKMIAAITSYEVTDPTVDSQIIQLKNAGADVFLNLSSPKFAAQGIRKAYDLAWRPVHYLTSPSASVQSVMKPAGFEAGQGIMTIAISRIQRIRSGPMTRNSRVEGLMEMESDRKPGGHPERLSLRPHGNAC